MHRCTHKIMLLTVSWFARRACTRARTSSCWVSPCGTQSSSWLLFCQPNTMHAGASFARDETNLTFYRIVLPESSSPHSALGVPGSSPPIRPRPGGGGGAGSTPARRIPFLKKETDTERGRRSGVVKDFLLLPHAADVPNSQRTPTTMMMAGDEMTV